jgi:hypothetical protein
MSANQCTQIYAQGIHFTHFIQEAKPPFTRAGEETAHPFTFFKQLRYAPSVRAGAEPASGGQSGQCFLHN